MKKFIGFGMFLALIVAPMATAFAQVGCNLYPVVPSDVGPYSSLLAVTNLSGTDWDDPDPVGGADDLRLLITTRVSGLTNKTTKFALDDGETLFVVPGDFKCSSGGVCTAYIEAGSGSALTADGTLIPGLTSTLFVTNGGSVITIISPIAYDTGAGNDCTDPAA